MEKTNYTITGKAAKGNKRVNQLVEFISKEYVKPGVSLGYAKFVEKFADWNESEKTVTAKSMDLHSDIQTACYITAKNIASALDENTAKKAWIPLFTTEKDGAAIITTVKASKFDDVYYSNIDAENAAAERKEKKAEKEKQQKETKETAVSVDAEAAVNDGANVMPILQNLITRYAAQIDFDALRKAIDAAEVAVMPNLINFASA